MSDLSGKDASQSVILSGADPSTGVESNYAQVDSSGNLQTEVNNASGAYAVNIQDGGNSITVDAVSLPLPTGAATLSEQQTQTTSLQLLDNAIGPVSAGTPSTNSLLGGAIYNQTLPSPADGQQVGFQADSNGRLRVSATIIESTRLTYSATATAFTVATTPTDVFTITGATNKIVKITKIEITSTTTSGSGISTTFNLVKRSTANSGGTSSTLTKVAHDSNNAAASATVLSYTANPTLGTAIGSLASRRVQLQPASALGPVVTFVWGGERAAQSPILRSTSEVLAVNFNSTTITGNITSIYVEWTEEDA